MLNPNERTELADHLAKLPTRARGDLARWLRIAPDRSSDFEALSRPPAWRPGPDGELEPVSATPGIPVPAHDLEQGTAAATWKAAAPAAVVVRVSTLLALLSLEGRRAIADRLEGSEAPELHARITQALDALNQGDRT